MVVKREQSTEAMLYEICCSVVQHVQLNIAVLLHDKMACVTLV